MKSDMTVEIADTFSSLLEHAADNDIEGFKRVMELDSSSIDEVGLWYSRRKLSKLMVYEQRTPLMVASMYGSVDIVKLILSLSIVDVNRCSGLDKSTALHCAASGGSSNSVTVVRLLLTAGADPGVIDVHGLRPVDVITISPEFSAIKVSLVGLLAGDGSVADQPLEALSVSSINTSKLNCLPQSSSPRNGPSSPSALESPVSPINPKFDDQPIYCSSEKKEYPIDPSLPDINTGIFSTDEFRMYSFKVRSCSRAYAHDWTECPFVHPGENARRRDPRKYHYSCVPCPDFRNGNCRRGDMCEYAHGVFESWLHPAQYRTRLCKDGINCNRRVCFFAHTAEELRPLYPSAGSAHSSPRSNSAMEIAASMNFFSGSPSSAMSPSAFTPPLSPSSNGISHSSMAWPQSDAPSLRLPGNNLQSSRLRSSLNARDMISADDFDRMIFDYDVQQHRQQQQQHQQQQRLLNELSCLSINNSNRSGRLGTLGPSNLDDLFSESSSPRYNDQPLVSAAFSPTHKSAILNHFQQQQTMLSPINTARFSPNNIDHSFLQQSPLRSSYSGRMSPRNIEPISPARARALLMAQQQDQLLPQFHSLSSKSVATTVAATVGSPVRTSSRWVGSVDDNPADWTFDPNKKQGNRMRRSSSPELGTNGEEPDLSWVQSLVKDPNEFSKQRDYEISDSKFLSESSDQSVIGSWVSQMQT